MCLSAIAFVLIIFSTVMLFAKIPSSSEAFWTGSTCPSALVVSGDKLMLIYNNEPIYFNNLDEYSEFVNHLRSQGIDCPISMLQPSTDNSTPPGGNAPVLDASRESTIYNTGSYPGFDPQGLNIGKYTDVDAVHDSTAKSQLSDNPMDINWGGVEYTQNSVLSGNYDENQVSKPTYFQPSVAFFPDANLSSNPASYISSNGSRQ